MSQSNITPRITQGNPYGESYDCTACGTKDCVPEESLFPWQYFSNPDKFRIQGTCMFCGSSTTLWHEDGEGNRIEDDSQ
jgi:hypothetical protein